MKYLILISCISLLGCSSKDVVPNRNLLGDWVEVSGNTDTLTFSSIESSQIMTLSRGTEFINGYYLPKAGSGPYYYQLYPEKISLRWLLSSNSAFNDYYFNQTDSNIIIENFYEDDSSDVRLTFRKIE